MISTRFPRTARVRARSDFDRIFKHGRRVALPVLALHWQTVDCEARLGLAVSRKVDPHAVGRNRIKRALRDTFRKLRADLARGDYVVVARPGASRCTRAELDQAFLGLLKRAGALPAPAVAGTMPAELASSDPAPIPSSLPDPGPG
ncbi:MAG: ribonuclease P protein component [Lysobacter sp.]|nr:ribonuclease P protein component [Lysobacter sp.]